MIEHINTINELSSEMDALLDLMQCSDSYSANVNSFQVVSSMCKYKLQQLMMEVEVLENFNNGKTR